MLAQHHQSPNQLTFPPALALPREHLAAIQHIINDALQVQNRATRPPPPPYNMQRSEVQWFKPRMDMYESPSASGSRPLVTATFELPGLRKEDVHIDVLDDHMIVAGDRRNYPMVPDAVRESTSTRDEDMNDGELTEKAEEREVAGANAGLAEQSRAGYTVREIKRGRFRRVVPLPAGTKLENIKASMDDGILTITFPGMARPVAHSIPVA